MTRDEMKGVRKALHFTQTQMAEALGLTLRAYQLLEAGDSEVRKLHVLALERITLAEAAKHGERMLALASVRKDADAIGKKEGP